MHQNKSSFQIEKHLSLVLYSQNHFISKQQVKAFLCSLWKNYNSTLLCSKDLFFGYSHEKVWKKHVLGFLANYRILNMLINLTVWPGTMKMKIHSCLNISTLNNVRYLLLFLIAHQRMNLQFSLFWNGCSLLYELVTFDKDFFFFMRTAGEGRMCESEKSE